MNHYTGGVSAFCSPVAAGRGTGAGLLTIASRACALSSIRMWLYRESICLETCPATSATVWSPASFFSKSVTASHAIGRCETDNFGHWRRLARHHWYNTESADEPSSTTKRLVFVSHGGPDTWVAKQIAREIEARGATPFLDEAQVDAGADFGEDILDFLQRAHELVVLLTPWALERPYVWAEIGAAWGRRIPIVALLLGITAAELQVRPGIPVLLKKRDLLELNDIEAYLKQLTARVQREG